MSDTIREIQALWDQQRIEKARKDAARLLDDINRAGGLYAHPLTCACCGCTAALRLHNQEAIDAD